MTPAVLGGVAQIRARFAGHPVHIREADTGGAFVIVEELALGALYVQTTTWLGALLDFNYPYSDVYPLYVRGDLARVDGRPLGAGTSPCTWEGRPAIQLSRRSRHLDPRVDRADLKFLKTLAWIRSHE